MVTPLSRPLLQLPRQVTASSSRLPASSRLFSSSHLARADAAASSSSSSGGFTWSPNLLWGFDTTKPVGSLFNQQGTTAVKHYHHYLLRSLQAETEALAALAPGDATAQSLREQSVLSIVGKTSGPLAMHQLKPLPTSYDEERKGMDLSKQREEIAAENQIINELNKARKETLEPKWDRLFYDACEAVNHNFFLSSLRYPEDPGSYPLAVEQHIVASFGSNSGFEQTVIGNAEGMASSGWLWLVQERNGGLEDLAVVMTVGGSGTLLVHGGKPIRGSTADALRYLGFDGQGKVYEEEEVRSAAAAPSGQADPSPASGARAFSTSPASSAAEDSSSSTSDPFPQHRPSTPSTFGTLTRRPVLAGNGRPVTSLVAENELVPLACLSMHEHAYMPTHGVWGKRAYVQAWLEALDWEKIARRMVVGNAPVAPGRFF